jgi:hypothetical protein
VVEEAAAYRRHLAMRGWVAVRPSKIAPACKDLSVWHSHRAEPEISLPRLVQGNPHLHRRLSRRGIITALTCGR